MSNYTRVLPRDLFNEASLLKCIGALWIALDEKRNHSARIEPEDVPQFDIMQEESSGALFVQNIRFSVDGLSYRLTRPLNSRQPWPLYAESDDDCFAVFDDTGALSVEFCALINLPTASA